MELSILQRVRRNHAIEHAAMHVLGRTLQGPKLAARSDWRGITFYGDVDTRVLENALEGGLLALNSGHRGLAMHPRCGSMISASMLLAMLAGWLVQLDLRRNRTPGRGMLSVAGVTGAMLLAQPLGYAMQKYVLTDPDASRAHLVSIRSSQRGPLTRHRITITHS